MKYSKHSRNSTLPRTRPTNAVRNDGRPFSCDSLASRCGAGLSMWSPLRMPRQLTTDGDCVPIYEIESQIWCGVTLATRGCDVNNTAQPAVRRSRFDSLYPLLDKALTSSSI